MSTRQSCHPGLVPGCSTTLLATGFPELRELLQLFQTVSLVSSGVRRGRSPPRAGAHADSSPRPHMNTRLALPSWYGAPYPPSARAAQDKRLASPLRAPTCEPSVLSGHLPCFRLFAVYTGVPWGASCLLVSSEKLGFCFRFSGCFEMIVKRIVFILPSRKWSSV